MSNTTKGILAGIFASVCYGTNPLGALNCYHEGLNTISTLCYRYVWAVLLMAVIMAVGKKRFALSRRESLVCLLLGVMFMFSSVFLFLSFNYMDAGLASTILFSYPIMVAVIMAVFFREKITLRVLLSLVLAVSGVVLLSRGEGAANLIGVTLVLASSLTYAVYIVAINKLDVRIPSITMAFYVSVVALFSLLVAGFLGFEGGLMTPTSLSAALWSGWLGLFPTVLALVFINISIKLVGSTPAAIMGAIEPMTAVAIGCLVFGEAFSLKLLSGMLLILGAVMLIIVGKTKKETRKSPVSSDKISGNPCF